MQAEFTNFENIAQNESLMIKKMMICTDQDRIQQIVLNLLSNAIKFTKQGGYIKVKAKYISDRDDLTY